MASLHPWFGSVSPIWQATLSIPYGSTDTEKAKLLLGTILASILKNKPASWRLRFSLPFPYRVKEQIADTCDMNRMAPKVRMLLYLLIIELCHSTTYPKSWPALNNFIFVLVQSFTKMLNMLLYRWVLVSLQASSSFLRPIVTSRSSNFCLFKSKQKDVWRTFQVTWMWQDDKPWPSICGCISRQSKSSKALNGLPLARISPVGHYNLTIMGRAAV